jgi:drug/metabolite transporter (DMT)-like permease
VSADSVDSDLPPEPPPPRVGGRTIGLLALLGVILAFSAGSTLVKLSHTPGVTVAFWRMILCSAIWIVILRLSEHRWLSRADLRASLLPGAAFGLNIAFFFTGVTKTTVAAAEFTGALTPLLVVPAGMVLFKEKVRPGALTWGLVSLFGLALVLFNAPPTGEFSWGGVAWVGAATTLWATYLLTSRSLRQGRSVAVVMAHITPIAAVVTLPLAIFAFPGSLGQVTWRSVVFIVILGVLTGTVAHGLMVFAQQHVPIGFISMMQVSQPALAVVWSILFLGATVKGLQVVGMVLVIVGLALVTVSTQRGAKRDATLALTEGELAGPAG